MRVLLARTVKVLFMDLHLSARSSETRYAFSRSSICVFACVHLELLAKKGSLDKTGKFWRKGMIRKPHVNYTVN